MRGPRFTAAVLLLVGVLSFAAIPAGASAKGKPALQFTEAEAAVAPEGALVYVLLNFGHECLTESTGKLGTNPDKKLTVTASALRSTECEPGVSQSGYVQEEAWKANANTVTLKVKAKLETAYPGPCAYTFTKLTSEPTELPALATVTGETTGRLNKRTSSKRANCAKTLTRQFGIFDLDAEEKLLGLSEV